MSTWALAEIWCCLFWLGYVRIQNIYFGPKGLLWRLNLRQQYILREYMDPLFSSASRILLLLQRLKHTRTTLLQAMLQGQSIQLVKDSSSKCHALDVF